MFENNEGKMSIEELFDLIFGDTYETAEKGNNENRSEPCVDKDKRSSKVTGTTKELDEWTQFMLSTKNRLHMNDGNSENGEEIKDPIMEDLCKQLCEACNKVDSHLGFNALKQMDRNNSKDKMDEMKEELEISSKKCVFGHAVYAINDIVVIYITGKLNDIYKLDGDSFEKIESSLKILDYGDTIKQAIGCYANHIKDILEGKFPIKVKHDVINDVMKDSLNILHSLAEKTILK